MTRNLVVFIDSGDTLVDESTQVYDDNGDVLRAELIEGAKEMMRSLRERGYRIALVADGTRRSFENVYTYQNMMDAFDAWIISEDLGTTKPDARMFTTALDSMGLTKEDAHRVVMVGNNLKRDVLGANAMGITSILLSYSPRYVMQPENDREMPSYVIATLSELLPLVDVLDRQIVNRRVLTQN